MRKLPILFSGILMFTLFCGLRTSAQEPTKPEPAAKTSEAPVHFYHLEFVVQELGADGKAVNSRNYTVDANTDRVNRNTSIRTGSRVPVPTNVSSFQYVDLGVNIDVRNAHEIDGKLSLEVNAEISSLATGAPYTAQGAPVIRSNRWQSPVLIPIGRQTIIYTSDSLDSKGNMQIQLTAKPLQ